MKKLLVILLLSAFTMFAQTKGKLVGGGAVWADSLTTYSASSSSDSLYIVDMNYSFSFPTITVVDTGTTYTDSIKVYKGTIRHYNSGAAVDTIWNTDALPVKDNYWAEDTTMVGAGKTRSYIIMDNSIRLLKVLRVNAEIVEGILTKVVIEGVKK